MAAADKSKRIKQVRYYLKMKHQQEFLKRRRRRNEKSKNMEKKPTHAQSSINYIKIACIAKQIHTQHIVYYARYVPCCVVKKDDKITK